MDDIIFVSMENWDEIWRRNQFVVAEFARRAPERKILFVGLPKNISHALRKGRFGEIGRALFGSKALSSPPELPNVTLFHPTKWLPNTLSVGRKFNRWMERREIKEVCWKIGIKNPLLWLNPHYAYHLAGRLDEAMVLYDITDDWTSLTQREGLRAQVIAEDAELLRRANIVVVCSERLYEMKRGRTKRLYLVPNGVEVERYLAVSHQTPEDARFAEAEATLPIPEAARAWPKPVFGYTGTLHPDRVDAPLIAELAKAYPQGTIALIGPSLLKPDEAALLAALPNVKLTGPVAYTELQAWMRAFDVCIVPHRVTPFTESLNPLKLFEYLAAGLPIVSTNVAGFREYGERAQPLVYLARGSEGSEREATFMTAIALALDERANRERTVRLREARQAEAAPASWSARVDKITEIIEREASKKLVQRDWAWDEHGS